MLSFDISELLRRKGTLSTFSLGWSISPCRSSRYACFSPVEYSPSWRKKLASCQTAPAPPPPLPQSSEEAFQVAEHALFDCLEQKIRLLDNAVSEARTVAAAVVAAWSRPFNQPAALYGKRLAPDDRGMCL